MDCAAVGKGGIVFNDQSVIADVEGEGGHALGVVGVLQKFVGEGGVALKVFQLRTEVAEIVDASGEEQDPGEGVVMR